MIPSKYRAVFSSRIRSWRTKNKDMALSKKKKKTSLSSTYHKEALSLNTNAHPRLSKHVIQYNTNIQFGKIPISIRLPISSCYGKYIHLPKRNMVRQTLNCMYVLFITDKQQVPRIGIPTVDSQPCLEMDGTVI